MSKQHDELVAVKVSKENESELRKIKADLEQTMKLKTSLVSLVNSAIALGIPELRKQNGGGK